MEAAGHNEVKAQTDRSTLWTTHRGVKGPTGNKYLLWHWLSSHRSGSSSGGGGGGSSCSVWGRDGGVQGSSRQPGWNRHPRTDQLQRTHNRTGEQTGADVHCSTLTLTALNRSHHNPNANLVLTRTTVWRPWPWPSFQRLTPSDLKMEVERERS